MNKIENLIFHCSDSTWGDVDVIRKWHVKDRGWRDIGYNGVILNGYRKNSKDFNSKEVGEFEKGRGLDLDIYVNTDERGAHVLGYNKNSIGICLIGKDKFSVKQFETAIYFARLFKRVNREISIRGHYEMPTANGKTCPNFDMDLFRNLVNNYKHNLLGKIELIFGNNILI